MASAGFLGLRNAAFVSRAALAIGLLGAFTTAAYAEINPTLERASVPGQGGARVGEGVYLKLGLLAEAGFDSNVFYNDRTKVDSPTLVVTPRVEITNAPREGQNPPVRYNFGAALVYREYLSDDPTVREQRAFNPAISGTLGYAGSESFTLTATDTFARIEEPPYTPNTIQIQRDLNIGAIDMRITPGGGRLQNTVQYTNTLSLFEGDSTDFAHTMTHQGLIGLSWKWLPKTAVFVEGLVGYVNYLDEVQARAQSKFDSVPYGARAGIRGLITPKTTLNLSAGYHDAAYDSDAVNPSGASNLFAAASLTFRPNQLSSFGLAYEHTFRDSPFVGNFVDVDATGVNLSQQLGPFVLRGFYVYEFRRYHGVIPVTRKDHLQRAGLQADYFIQRWFFAGVGGTAHVNRSSLSASEAAAFGGSVDYTKFTVLGRLGITY